VVCLHRSQATSRARFAGLNLLWHRQHRQPARKHGSAGRNPGRGIEPTACGSTRCCRRYGRSGMGVPILGLRPVERSGGHRMPLPGEHGLRIGGNVRAARRSRGMSLEALAGLTGRSKGWLSRVENGHTRLERRQDIAAIAEALEVSADSLLGEPAPGSGPAAGRMTSCRCSGHCWMPRRMTRRTFRPARSRSRGRRSPGPMPRCGPPTMARSSRSSAPRSGSCACTRLAATARAGRRRCGR